MADIKDLIGGIIDTTDNSFPSNPANASVLNPSLTFDKGAYREKLSLGVLRDIVSAMLNDETENLEGMIDNSIIDHINRDYNGSCYNYLCKSCDKCNSPMLSDIIQEIDDKVDDTAEKISRTKDDTTLNDLTDPLELEKHVDNYAAFRENIKKKVADKIVNSVVAELIGNNEVPTFKDTLDDSLNATKPGAEPQPGSGTEENIESEDDITGDVSSTAPVGESVIISAAACIFQEAAGSMTYDEAIDKATIEYAISEMDACFRQYNNSFYHRYTK